MPQITASTARRSMVRRARSSADNVCAGAGRAVAIRASTTKISRIIARLPLISSKRVDVVQDRGLAQHDAPDHMADRDVVGEDRREPGAGGRQGAGAGFVVGVDAD